MPHYRNKSVVAAAVYLASLAVSANVHADNLYWQGGTADLISPSYFSPATPANDVAPSSASDLLYIGAGGTANATTPGAISIGRLFVGHNITTAGPDTLPGDGIVNIGPGVAVSTTTGAAGAVNAGVLVASGANGTLNINGGSLTVNTLLTIGYGTDGSLSGNVNVSNGGSLTISGNSLNLGDAPVVAGVQNGIGPAGNLTLSDGTISVLATSGNVFNIGIQDTSSFTQSGGTMTVGSTTIVGARNADGSSFTLTGGSFTTKAMSTANGAPSDGYSDNISTTISGGTLTSNTSISVANGAGRTTSFTVTGGSVTAGGSFLIANGTNIADNTNVLISGGTLTCGAFTAGATALTSNPTNTYITFSGSATATMSGNILIAQGAAINTNLTLTDNAVVTTAGTVTIGDRSSSNTTFNLGASAHLTVGTATTPTNFSIGKGSSTSSTFNMTGGQLDISGQYLMGTSTSATQILGTQSAGTMTTGSNFIVADTGTGDATYSLSGTGVIVAGGGGIIGHQKGTGVMNQTGGSATFNNSLRIGDSQGTDPAAYAVGTYTLSAGSLNASVPDPTTLDSLAIAPAGTGTLRIIGSSSSINVTGNMNVYANTNGGTNTGTLAFRLAPSQSSLTTINVTGTATFNAGSALQLDFNSVTPVQGLYTVLNAASIVNSGLIPFIPAGWNFSITSGGNGQLLKFFAGDLNADGRINADDFAIMDRGAAKHLTDGTDGDLNADGVINSQDYLLIDSAYAQLGGSLTPTFLAARESEFGDAYVSTLLASVPEPTSLFAACGLASPSSAAEKEPDVPTFSLNAVSGGLICSS